MGTTKRCVVDPSGVGDVSGLVIVSVVTSSALTATDVGVDAVVVRTVTVGVDVAASLIVVVSVTGGCDAVTFLGVVSWVDVAEAVGTAVLRGGCGEGEWEGGVRGGGVEVVAVGAVGGVEAEGEVAEARVVGRGREEVREGGSAPEDAVEGVTVVAAIVTAVDTVDGADVLPLVSTSGGVD